MTTKQVLRAVWDGPFQIGKLSQPVSVGDVLLKTLETIWRCIVGLVALIATVAATLAAWIYVVEPAFFPPLRDSLIASVTYDDGTGPPAIYIGLDPGGQKEANFRCTPQYPLRIKMVNRSDRSVGSVSFELGARHPNRTDEAIEYGGFRDSNRIIPANSWWLQCYSLPVLKAGVDPASLNYRINVWSAKSVAELTS